MENPIKILIAIAFACAVTLLYPTTPVDARTPCTLSAWAHDLGRQEVYYAIQISGCDEYFVWEIMRDSSFDHARTGGFCKLVPEMVADQRVWTNWRKQLRLCYTFYLDNAHQK